MFVQHTRSGSNAVHRRTTKGWQLLVQWKDGSSSWTPLKDLKESNPVEVAKYAVANKIAKETAFILSGGLKIFLEKQSDDCKGKVTLLEMHSQVWRIDSKVSQGSTAT